MVAEVFLAFVCLFLGCQTGYAHARHRCGSKFLDPKMLNMSNAAGILEHPHFDSHISEVICRSILGYSGSLLIKFLKS